MLPTSALKLIVIACLAMHGTDSWATPARAAAFYEDALKRYERRDLPGATIQLKNALKADNNQLAVHLLLGKVLLEQGEISAAEAAFDDALRLGVNRAELVVPLAEAVAAQGRLRDLLSNPRYNDDGLPADMRQQLLLIKAAAASDTGQTKEALRLVSEARAVTTGGASTWVSEASIQLRAGQIAAAKGAAIKAVQLEPQSATAAYTLGMVMHIAGDLKSAETEYSRAISLKPDHANALVARAGIRIDKRDLKGAEADAKLAREADPRDPRAAYLYALMAERAGNTALVKQLLSEVTSLVDTAPMEALRYRTQVLMLGGMSHYALGQYEKALPYLETLVRQDPQSPANKLLGQIYVRNHSHEKAVDALTAYLRRHGNDTQAMLLLASAHMAQGRSAKATQLTQEAMKLTDAPAVQAMHGMSLIGSGRFELGAAELENTLRREPGQIRPGLSLAALYLASGQAGKARTVMQGLVKAHPKNPVLLNLLGYARAAAGDAAGARSAYEEALKLAPDLPDAEVNLARLDIDQQRWDSGMARLNSVLAKDAKNVDALMEAARLHRLKRDEPSYVRWLQRADDVAGNRLQPGLELIDHHLVQGRADLAREALKRLQQRRAEAHPVLLAQARVLLAEGDTTQARATLNRVATEAGYDPAALVEVAELQVSADNIAGAAHALDKALSERPNHLRARVMRSSVYLLQNDPAKAEALARSVLATAGAESQGLGLLGDVAIARGQTQAALDAYRRAFEADKRSPNLLRLMQTQERLQRPAAIKLAEDWLRNRPQDARIWRELADMQARSGNLKVAKTAYESVVRLRPQDAEALNNLANVMITLQDPSALKVAEQALALRPQAAHIIGTTGWAAHHAKQPARALQLLRDARLRDPNNPDTRYFLGAVLSQQGKHQEARVELQAALAGQRPTSYQAETRALLTKLGT